MNRWSEAACNTNLHQGYRDDTESTHVYPINGSLVSCHDTCCRHLSSGRLKIDGEFRAGGIGESEYQPDRSGSANHPARQTRWDSDRDAGEGGKVGSPIRDRAPENIGSFHFHGNVDDFPITSVIVVAKNVKDETILQGRYESGTSEVQFARPAVVVRELMSMVFRVNQFFNANAILIAISTALLLLLVVLLSLRLRQREMETMFKLGCSRGTIAMLQIGEMGIIFGVALILLAFAVWGVWLISGDVVESLLVNSK